MRSQETTNFNIIAQAGPRLTNKRRNTHVPVWNLVCIGQPDEIVEKVEDKVAKRNTLHPCRLLLLWQPTEHKSGEGSHNQNNAGPDAKLSK